MVSCPYSWSFLEVSGACGSFLEFSGVVGCPSLILTPIPTASNMHQEGAASRHAKPAESDDELSFASWPGG